ncbi:MAG: ribosome-associated translation inhibitor RaiA [Chlamydiae bacterium]|nr:ribosome-associated translation inhibitor RaiA [Chlamydiota bacterium]
MAKSASKTAVKQKFANEGYTVYVQGKNIQITEPIQKYVFEKLDKLERFADHILDVHVTLDVQKLSHTCAIHMKFLHFNIQVHATTGDLYGAIDATVDKLAKLIQKYKSRLQNHRCKKDLAAIDMKVHVLKPIEEIEEINDDIDNETLKEEEIKYKLPKIVAKETLPVRHFNQEEAIMNLDLSGLQFLIYRADEDKKLRVMYKRPDGLGIIEVE